MWSFPSIVLFASAVLVVVGEELGCINPVPISDDVLVRVRVTGDADAADNLSPRRIFEDETAATEDREYRATIVVAVDTLLFHHLSLLLGRAADIKRGRCLVDGVLDRARKNWAAGKQREWETFPTHDANRNFREARYTSFLNDRICDHRCCRRAD